MSSAEETEHNSRRGPAEGERRRWAKEMMNPLFATLLLALATVSCSKQPAVTTADFDIDEVAPQGELLRRVQDHDGTDNPFIFSFPYHPAKLSSGDKFGHKGEALCISFKGKTNLTVLVCDSNPWTKPVDFALSSHGTVDFDLVDMHSNQIIGKFSFGLESRLLKSRN